MNTIEPPQFSGNLHQVAVAPRKKPSTRKARFRVFPFTNPSGKRVWRVSGCKSDGARVRENYRDENKAKCRRIDLEAEYLQQPRETSVRATKLSDDQLQLAELAILRLGDEWSRLVDAVDHWKQTGGQLLPDSPLLYEALDQYLEWLEKKSPFRDATKRHWRVRMKTFKKSVTNIRLAQMTPDFIEHFLDKRTSSAACKDTDRRAVSRFFSWCIERPRRWVAANPCREVRIQREEKGPVAILAVEECKSLLRAAEAHGGELAPYLAVCLFAGLRPFETARLSWEQINLKDGEITIHATQSKTGRGRTVKIGPSLKAWLKKYHDKSIYPKNWQKKFATARKVAGLQKWTPDIMRHTAISHYFRQTGSYGYTAEQFDNSEAIIKSHYQGRVSSADTKAFYRLLPGKTTNQGWKP
jgi:integrase